MHCLLYCMRLLLLFYFSILDCDNPVCFWSWGIDVVAGRQNAKGVGSIAFVRLGRWWPALFLVRACGPRDTREWYGVYKMVCSALGSQVHKVTTASLLPLPPALIVQNNPLHPRLYPIPP